MRTFLAVLAGVLSWGILANLAIFLLRALSPDSFNEDGVPQSTAVLAVMVGLTPLYSLIAGFLAARIAVPARWRAVLILTGVNLAIGLAVELSAWDLAPAWYHLILLALVIPAHLAGGRLGGAQPGA